MSGTRDSLNLSWLVRLRWGATFGQVFTVLVVTYVLGVPLPHAWIWPLIAFGLLSNVGLAVHLRAGGIVRQKHVAAVMALDVLLLTALLYLTGGPFNPFSFLYLVYIALAAVVLRPGDTWFLVGLSLVGSALLFLDHRPLELPATSHDEHMRWHLWGMWVAFGVAAGFIVYALMRILRALAAREAELAVARERAVRQEKLASLATLAGGAAHELGTPLSTIAVVAKELERRLAAEPDLLADVKLVRTEVDRCRQILDQMAAQAGESSGEESQPITVAELLDAAIGPLPESHRILRQANGCGGERLSAPRRALAQAIRVLVRNAQDASGAGDDVQVTADIDGDNLRIEVVDHGAGMGPDVLARVGEPFFTTKEAGRGMGLGVFLCRAVAERLGGALAYDSEPGAGTRATLRIPMESLRQITARARKHDVAN